MKKIIFCCLLVLICCFFGETKTIKAIDTYDISGQCVEILMPIGSHTTPEDVCLAAGYGRCQSAGGTFKTYLMENCVPPSLFKNGVDCNSVRNLAVPAFHKSASVDTLICYKKGWGAILKPKNVPEDIDQAAEDTTNWILGSVSMIAVIMLVFGGIKYITSAGDEDRARAGKKTVTYTLLGIVVIGMAYAIIEAITMLLSQ